MPHVEVDGLPVEVRPGETVLDAARAVGADVPTLCHDPRLEPAGACRLCEVEVEGQAHLLAACTTPALEGMRIRTDTDEVRAQQRAVLDLLARDHPSEAPAAQPERPFHALLADHGLAAQGVASVDVDDSHPTIRVDLAQCIDCYRCVRICADVQGQFVWQVLERGHDTHVLPDSGGPLGTSSCVSCGACVDTCPTGALTDRSVVEHGPADTWTRSVCSYCGVGCELQVGTRQGEVVQVLPARDAPSNKGHLCVKGRYGYGYTSAPDRLRSPRVRRGGRWSDVGWDEAVDVVASGLRRVLDEHGPQAVGVLASARSTNEENYVAQKLARVALGTNNVDCCARVCHAPSAAALGTMLGTGAATSCYDDIELAATILVCGTNTTENHPVVGARIKQAARAGARLVVIDPRAIELTRYADLHLRPRPGTNVALLNALACTILEEGLVDEAFVSERVEGFAGYAANVSAYRPEVVAEVCGVEAALIRAAARAFAAGPSMSFHGLGVTEHEQGVDGVSCLVNLALLTGNLGRPGAGVNPLRGQNNVQGSAHMGCEPAHLTGYATLDAGRERFEGVWGAPVPAERGLDAMQMIDAAAAGTLKALWVIGWDILLTQPQQAATAAALSRLDLLVVQDLFVNETAREHATVVLPAASAFEKDGTFMSSERRVQRVRKAVEPPGQALPDWEILSRVAAALGHGEQFAWADAEQVWDEVRQVWPAGAGMTYARLEQPGGLQWPCPDEHHPGTPRLHTDSFPGLGPRAALRLPEHRDSSDPTDEHFPFTLVTGRGLYQFNAGTMTRRSATHHFRSSDTLEVCAGDAQRLGLVTGTPVVVTSRYGEAVVPAEVTERVPPGVVFATFSDPSLALNHVTGPHRDPVTHTPSYKVTAVRLLAAP